MVSAHAQYFPLHLTHLSLCLTCERLCRGGYTGKSVEETTTTRSRSPTMSSSTRFGSPVSSRKTVRPSALRNALGDLMADSRAEEDPIAGPSGTQNGNSEPVTPRKPRPKASLLSIGGVDSPATDATRSEPGSPSESGPPRRERYQRKAARNAQHFSFLKRPIKPKTIEPETSFYMDEEDEDIVRCVTCAKPMHERIWYNNKYFDHCARLVMATDQIADSQVCSSCLDL
jgi:histone-lysine N-methyltransferase SUV420H